MTKTTLKPNKTPLSNKEIHRVRKERAELIKDNKIVKK